MTKANDGQETAVLEMENMKLVWEPEKKKLMWFWDMDWELEKEKKLKSLVDMETRMIVLIWLMALESAGDS